MPHLQFNSASPSLPLSFLTAIFPGEPGVASFISAKDDGGGCDNWSYNTCKAPVKCHHKKNQQPTFYRSDALPVTQPTWQSTEGKSTTQLSTQFYHLMIKITVSLLQFTAVTSLVNFFTNSNVYSQMHTA